MQRYVFLWVLFLLLLLQCSGEVLRIDDSNGVGRRFDGIGGISGGGATSRLLVSYPEPYRSQILDYLFKPNFGASLHILKVEIGGDAQSTDGTEPSHMHTADDQNYERGYEWWLLMEAKKRNPNILTYGLSWAFPGWVGKGSGDPYKYPEVTAQYVANWYIAARDRYNITVDFAGIWNEREYDATYIKTLRKTLDAAGLQHTRIVAADGSFKEICKDMHKDSGLFQAVDFVGAHYPGTISPSECSTLEGKQLWASEDYSTYADAVGGGCWARILNQNYVNGNMTSTISWNLIASYYDQLPFNGDGLMWATNPWSGSYEVTSPVWVSAHTTQFTQPGWHYLKVGSGSGHLPHGGSYVTLVNGTELSIIIEKMSHDHSICIRPFLPPFDVAAEIVTFELDGSFAHVKTLRLWFTRLSNDVKKAVNFQQLSDISVINGRFSLSVEVDCLYTLSTLHGQQHGSHPKPPNPKPFPLPYTDDFDSYTLESEADYFADQSGSWQLAQAADESRGRVMRQSVTERPIVWCNDAPNPISLLGDYYQWTNIDLQVDVMIEHNGAAMLCARVDMGGCDTVSAHGIFFWVDVTGRFLVTGDVRQRETLASGFAPVKSQHWSTMRLVVNSTHSTGLVDGHILFIIPNPEKAVQGFAGIGSSLDYVQFDNFAVKSLFPAGEVCGYAEELYPQEDTSAVLQCREPGQKISKILFASFGTPEGGCGAYRTGKCHASSSIQVVEALCMGENFCEVPCSTDVFGDPCPNVHKHVALQAVCA